MLSPYKLWPGRFEFKVSDSESRSRRRRRSRRRQKSPFPLAENISLTLSTAKIWFSILSPFLLVSYSTTTSKNFYFLGSCVAVCYHNHHQSSPALLIASKKKNVFSAIVLGIYVVGIKSFVCDIVLVSMSYFAESEIRDDKFCLLYFYSYFFHTNNRTSTSGLLQCTVLLQNASFECFLGFCEFCVMWLCSV